jgi:spermidine/putrescine transport system ATP-binding protein
MDNVIIRLEDISVAFDGEVILDKLNLNIRDKEFVTLLGPSGCGKTTTLRIIGGFTRQDSGNVFFADKIINDLPPYKRNVNTIFQKYALFPHLNVFENVAYGLRIKKIPKAEIEASVKEMLKLVNLSGFEKRDVASLSGGQQQRVAIARALVNKPHVLLLDEPLGALDLKLRKEMQIELKNMQIQTGITFIYVTHDQEEALTMSDTVVVMNDGVIQQVGTPQDIYNEPLNAFVADFIGESNILDGIMINDYSVEFSGRKFQCVDKGFGENVSVGVVVRPEDIKITEPDKGMLKGSVESVIFKGVHYEMIVSGEVFNGKKYKWTIQSTLALAVGSKIGMNIQPFDIHIMKGE